MSLSASEKLRRFYDQFSSDDHVLIVIDADPDSIACAMAVKRLLWRKVAGIDISNINIIKRPDNLAMIRLLGVKLTHISKIDKAGFNRFVMVDSQPEHNESFSEITPDVIIDHHPGTGAQASFTDIRPQYGAAASILTEYLRAAKIKPSSKLATGLFFAIKTDTNNFVRQTSFEDVRAFQFLFCHVNIHLAQKIEHVDLQIDFLKYFRRALLSKRMRKGRIYVHLGTVENPDVCVLIADFFMRVNSVRWSIVSGSYGKKLIIVFRNDGVCRNAGDVAKKSFSAIGSAGGHKSMARAEISIADLNRIVTSEDDKKLLKWIIEKIEKKVVS
ncbi:MAG: DHH family phosphoesterase [Deltaproteobacteria bacterium]|nr:DHH family phosphoesterase [Deltaproteobacteria bacterium]MBW2660505.1 DHH family phosphoesterase [Deltaproteobacteria bacterium]